MVLAAFTRRSFVGMAVAGGALTAKAALRDRGTPSTFSWALSEFGGGPGTLDNTSALRAACVALSAHGGGLLELGPGTHSVSSAALGSAGIAVPSNVTLRGAGRRDTILQVVGTTACNLLVAENQGAIAIEDMAIVGNNVSPPTGSPYGVGAAIRWIMTDAAILSVSGFALRRIHLENFRAPYWVEIQNLSISARALEMRRVIVDDLTFASRPGNSIAPGDIGHNAAVLCVSGHRGMIEDVRISRISGDARYIKSGVILYQQVRDAVLKAVRVTDAGREGARDNCGGYAIQIYDSSCKMESVTIDSPVINNPRSAGIYVAGASDVLIVNPQVSGQTDPEAGTLPKGAIVFNGTRRWLVRGGTLSSNWRDIDVAMPDQGSPEKPYPVEARITGIRSEGSSEGLSIRHATGHVATGIHVDNCRWYTTQRTVLVQNSANTVVSQPPAGGGYVDGITFESCHLEAAVGYRAVDLWGVSGSPAGGYTLANSTLIGSNPLFAREQAGSIRVSDCIIRDLGTTAGNAAATLLACPSLDIRNCVLEAPGPKGVGIDLAGSTGSIRGLTFPRCTYQTSPIAYPVQLGQAMPTFVGRAGQFVQNLASSPGNTAGWICSGGNRWKRVNQS